MMLKRLVYLIGSILFLVLFSTACVESGGANDNETVTITINWPKSKDTVEVGKNTIDYKVSNPYGKSFEEFYVSINQGEFVETFEADDNRNGTELLLNIDSVYLHKKIDYFIQVKTTDNLYFSNTEQTNLYVTDDTAPPEGSDIVLTLTKYTSTTQSSTTFGALLVWKDTLKNVEFYEVWKRTNQETSFSLLEQVDVETYSYDDPNLSRFLVYYYKVRAKNKYGYSDWSNVVGTNDDDDAAPSNLVAEALGATKIRLTWDDNLIVKDGYWIERSSDYGTDVIYYKCGSCTEYLDEGLYSSTTYSYRIKSIKISPSSESEWSNYADAATWGEDVDPPQSLNAVFDQTTRSVIIDWVDINYDGVTGTVIERSDNDGLSFIKIATVDEGVEKFSDTYELGNSKSIDELQNYIYRAYHTVRDGSTDYSNEDNAYVPAFVPFAPTNVELSFTNSNQFTITWDWKDDIAISEFVVQAYNLPFGIPDNSNPDQYGSSVSANGAKSFSASQPTNPVERTFVVRAVRNVNGASYYSELMLDSTNTSIDALADAVNNKKIISFTRNNDNTTFDIVYSASDGPDPEYFQVERAVDWIADEYEIIKQVEFTSNRINFETDGTNYWMSHKVRAVYNISGTQYYSPAYELN